MRKFLIIITLLFTLLSIVFSVLPLDTLAFLPIGASLVLCLLLLYKSETTQKKFPKVLLYITTACSALVLGKMLLIKDEVETDQEFEKQKIETKIEAQKELQELEALENDLE